MAIKLQNNAESLLDAPLGTSDTVIEVQTGGGAQFPTLISGDYFYATLSGVDGAREIVKVTARTGDTLTVVRAQEGTTAAGFSSGAKIELRVTAASVRDLVAEHDDASEIAVADAGGYFTATNVEDVLQEIGAGGIELPASNVSVVDSGGYFTATNVEDALQEIASGTVTVTASNVSVVDAGGYFAGTDVESVLQELGASGGSFGVFTFVDNFVGDGVDTTFTLGREPLAQNLIDVYINGVYQDKNTFVFSGTTLIFNNPPPLNAGIEVVTNANITAGAISATNVLYTPAGSGAVVTNVQAKLRETLISRNEYDTDGNFNSAKAASPTVPSLDGVGNFESKITPEGESTQIDLSAAVRPSGGMNRGRVNYRSVDSVEVIVPEDIVMGGFRFMGQYKKGRAPVYKSGVPYRAIVNFGTDLGAESTPKADNWYAVFACANDGDTNVTYKLMPFLRVGSVVGSLCNLSSNAENTFTDVPTTYSWSAGNDTLAGVDCLVINEGADNRFSGRIATITDSRADTVLLDTIGQIGALDFLLPAPPNFDHYCYLATFYLETSPVPLGVEARNIADSGVIVMGRNVNNTDPNWTSTGAVAGPPGNKIEWSTLISPLATGAYFISTMATSTSGGGDIFTHFSHDGSNHEVAVHSYYKAVEASASAQTSNTFVCFSQGQFMYFWVDGGLASSRVSSNLLGTGWIEP